MARYDLGLGEEETWRETPRRILLLLDRRGVRDRREDRRAGTVAAAVYNVHRDRKRHPDPLTWEDLFPEHSRPKESQSPEEMLAVATLLNAAYGGKDLRLKDA